MVINKIGGIFQYKGMTYTIGQRIYANGQSDWEGLFGVITEIRTDGKHWIFTAVLMSRFFQRT